jgi:hypothetical protein
VNKAKLIQLLKQKFHTAKRIGKSTLDKSLTYMKEKPEQTALFTLLAANIIKKGIKRN